MVGAVDEICRRQILFSVPQLLQPAQASETGGFLIRKNPLGVNGFWHRNCGTSLVGGTPSDRNLDWANC
jgi:hypothetical protein